MSLNIFLKQIHKIVPEFDAQIGKIKKKEKKQWPSQFPSSLVVT